MSNKFAARIDALRALMAEQDIEGLYVSGVPNVAYFTGKKGDDCTLYINREHAYILTDFRYLEMAQSMKDWLEFVQIGANMRIRDFLNAQKEKTISVEKDWLSLSEYLLFKDTLEGKEIRPVSGLVEKLRMVKDADEIEYTRQACSISSDAFTHMLNFIRPGVSEKEIATELEYTMKKAGAEGLSFDTIAICGKKTSMPHGVPGDNVVADGDFVTMDYGCLINGYASDMTRTVAVGHASEEMVKVYHVVLDAQLTACEKIHAGLTGKVCDAFARDIITEAGYGEYFGHSLGHGTGLQIHEAPNYSPNNDQPIPENAICSIEPGIYLPGKFGVRIEDLALVKNDGIINFVTAPKELIII